MDIELTDIDSIGTCISVVGKYMFSELNNKLGIVRGGNGDWLPQKNYTVITLMV